MCITNARTVAIIQGRKYCENAHTHTTWSDVMKLVIFMFVFGERQLQSMSMQIRAASSFKVCIYILVSIVLAEVQTFFLL